MDQLTPSLAALLEAFRPCFRQEVFCVFRLMTAAWLVCLGRRTISRVWQTTGRSASHSHCPACRLFSQAVWNFDELGRILLVELLFAFVPGTRVFLVIDDTLCHKRGAKVAFGGIFLDAVLSSKGHKVFRFGNNWATLGLVVELPFRKDRFFCCNVLWRVCARKGKAKAGQHKTKPQLAREMVELAASWLPGRELVVLADRAYTGKALLKGLPDGVAAIGPVHKKAALTLPLPQGYKGRRKIGEGLTSPAEAFADGRWARQDLLLRHPRGEKQLQVKVIGPCCWYNSAGQRPLLAVLVRDPDGKWRDEALLSSDLGLSAHEVVLGYLRRWGVEVAYCESKQMLGFHDPKVHSEGAVRRAHPMAWFVGGLVVLWYAQVGQDEPQARSHRPWYKGKVSPTFADMLGCLRPHLWSNWLGSGPGSKQEKLVWLLEYLATAA